mgnify:CR=1 FL=1
MDDLAGKISEILNDPASMEKIKNLSNMLGIAPDSQDSSPTVQTAPASPQSANPLEALLGSLGGNGQRRRLGALAGLSGLGAGGGNQSVSPEMLQSILKIAPLLSSVQQEDDNTRLLYALRPFLKPQRQKRLDESANMMRMFKLLPLLKGSGILGGLL